MLTKAEGAEVFSAYSRLFIISIFLACFSLCNAALISNQSVEEIDKEIHAFLQQGQFQKAISLLAKQVEAHSLSSHIEKEVATLIQLAEAQQAIGEYHDSEQSLLSALSIAHSSKKADYFPQIYAALGNLYIALGPVEKAIEFIHKAIQLVDEDSNGQVLKAVMLNNLGKAYMAAGQNKRAIQSYKDSTVLASKTDNKLLQAKSLANSARLRQEQDKFLESEKLIHIAVGLLEQVEYSHEKIYLLLNLGRTDFYLAGKQPTARSHQLFSQADQLAIKIDDQRASSYALGYLGELYEQDKRYQESLVLTQRAIFQAQQLGNEDARQLLFLWYWQKARLYEAINDRKEAIKAYQMAVEQVQELRYQMQVSYQNHKSSFEEVMQPVYLRLVDLLLQEAEHSAKSANAPELLFKARNTVEQLKAAELRDYFHDQCVDALQAKVQDVGQVSQTALVIYPVILDNRLELLLTLPGGKMKRYSTDVTKNNLVATVSEFRRLLEKRTTNEYRVSGKQLYQWLVKPYEDDLLAYNIETLIFVPDGILRTIPMAALYHDKKFLIQEYAIAITPSIELTDPKPIDNQNVNPLYAGVSESVQGFSALEYVTEEINGLNDIQGGKILLDQEFRTENLEISLGDKNLNILHIATHAQFGKNASESFILTYDNRVTINQLADYVGLFKFRETPLDLLVLSACETAQGDERSALGLSGIAVKAGARSALGALWHVDDAATALLMQGFYQELYKPDKSRALALQLAQKDMIADLSYKHPAYWSSYILINSWL